MNWAVFWHADTNSKKLEFNSHWVDMVKYVCGLFGHGTLRPAVSQE